MVVNYLNTKGLSGKSTAFMLETVLPIVKLPSNLVGEGIDYATGSVTGSIKALKYVLDKDALKGLTGHEADNILRSLKKGSVGVGLLAMGYYAGRQGGFVESSGFHQQTDKQKPKFSIGGVELPEWVLDTPAGLVFQVGATIKRVNDYYTVKGKSGGFVAGATAGALGVANKVPFVGAAKDIGKAMENPDSAGLFIDDLIQSLLIPPDVRKVAQMTDDQKRKPTNLKETLENAVPGLRENVPTKNAVPGLRKNVPTQNRRYSIRGRS
jgi:hypothetical protein